MPTMAPACRHFLLAGHYATALGRAAARLDAFLHVAQAITGGRALVAYLSALSADMLVMLGPEQHEMRRRSADFRARHHQAEVRGLDMLATDFQAVVHGRTEACLITVQ